MPKAKALKTADKFFRRAPNFLGSDVASSIDLGGNRILWLFGDTFAVKKLMKTRDTAALPRNSVGIQKGKSVYKSPLKVYWRKEGDPKSTVFLGSNKGWGKKEKLPSSFFAEEEDNFFWPIHGIKVKDKLFIFMMCVVQERVDDPFGFLIYNWRCAVIDNPHQSPKNWNVKYYQPPKKHFGIVLGTWLMEEGDFIYCYGVKEPGNHSLYLARWGKEDFYKENFKNASWWCGKKEGWKKQSNKIKPKPVFTKGHTELSVHYDAKLKKYVAVQNVGDLGGPIGLRFAERPEGPWTEPKEVFSPEERSRKDSFVYAAKAHPLFSKPGEITATYLTNTLDVNVVINDLSVFWPRFVKIKLI